MKKKTNSLYFKNFVIAAFTLCMTNIIMFALIFLLYPVAYRSSLDTYFNNLTEELIVDARHAENKEELKLVLESYEHKYKLSSIIIDEFGQTVEVSKLADRVSVESIDQIVEGYDFIDLELDEDIFHYFVINNQVEFNDDTYHIYTLTTVTRTKELFLPFVQMYPLIASAIIIQAVIISGIVTRLMIKPIDTLSKKAHAITELDFDNQYHWDSSDEYGMLSNDLDIMQEKMEQVISRLEDDSYLNHQLVIAENKEQIAILSHELNTPLTILRMQNELLLTRDFDEATTGYIKRNLRKVDEISELVDTILNYKELEVVEHVKLSEIIVGMLESKSVYKNVKFELNNEVEVAVAPIYLKRLISNMLNNAIKYNFDNQAIVATLDGDVFKVVNTHRPDFEFDRSLLKPYVRGGNQNDAVGHGLGLYICDRICTLNKFTFDVKSQNQKFNAIVKFGEIEKSLD